MLVDWYSLSHIVHGLLFYAALWLIARRWPVEWRFLIALIIESAWEVTENMVFVIDRYRETTAALGYTGDSVINSLSDILDDVRRIPDRAEASDLGFSGAAHRPRDRAAVRHPRQPDAQRMELARPEPRRCRLAGGTLTGTIRLPKH